MNNAESISFAPHTEKVTAPKVGLLQRIKNTFSQENSSQKAQAEKQNVSKEFVVNAENTVYRSEIITLFFKKEAWTGDSELKMDKNMELFIEQFDHNVKKIFGKPYNLLAGQDRNLILATRGILQIHLQNKELMTKLPLFYTQKLIEITDGTIGEIGYWKKIDPEASPVLYLVSELARAAFVKEEDMKEKAAAENPARLLEIMDLELNHLKDIKAEVRAKNSTDLSEDKSESLSDSKVAPISFSPEIA